MNRETAEILAELAETVKHTKTVEEIVDLMGKVDEWLSLDPDISKNECFMYLLGKLIAITAVHASWNSIVHGEKKDEGH